MPQARKVTILSLGTDAVVYDFAAAKAGGNGIQTTEISNSINSDLLRGLQLTLTHELFKPLVDGSGGGTTDVKRQFSPHLSRISATFSLSNNAWLFRFLGLGRKTDAAPPTGSEQTPVPQQPAGGVQPTGALNPEYGVIGMRSTQTSAPAHGPMGSWNASFNLTIERPRAPDGLSGLTPTNNSMINANLSFQPTPEWNVAWQTAYSFSPATKGFTEQTLRFIRQMHDWDADFDFVKAPNGNYSFLFNVRLRANPDIKFDYSQHTNIANGSNR